jgi:enediyne biosynthesis protein E4
MLFVPRVKSGRSGETCSSFPIKRHHALIALLLLSPVNAVAQKSNLNLEFRDIAALAGLNFMNVCGEPARKDYILESTGCGVAIFDFDRDGYPDVFLVNGSRLAGFPGGQEPTNHLYRNLGNGKFADVTARAGLAKSGWGQGACVGDYDNDGWDDLFVTYYGTNLLYHNNGNGTFSDVTAKAGLPLGGKRWGTGCAFLDYDLDGYLDLFVANYVDFDITRTPERGANRYCVWKDVPVFCGPRGLPKASNVLYHNQRNGTFADVSNSAGILVSGPGYYGLGVVVSDFDNDGYPDIYVACDSTPNILYHNQGNGTFKDIAVLAGAAYNLDGVAQAGMGVAAGDYDNDGRFDIFVTNFSEDTSTLYHNDGTNFFSDLTSRAGLAKNLKYLGWGTALADFDQDGWKDIIVANGHIYPEADQVGGTITYKQRMLLYRNSRDGRFADISDQAGPGFRETWSARGLAIGDLSNAGTLDIVINSVNDRAALLRNLHPAGNCLLVQTIGTKSNRDGIGARVSVTANGLTQTDEVRSGGSYMSNSDSRLHFGLGMANRAAVLRIVWPSRLEERFSNLAANNLVVLKEGAGIVRTVQLRKTASAPAVP